LCGKQEENSMALKIKTPETGRLAWELAAASG
jgi:hypothetical protein